MNSFENYLFQKNFSTKTISTYSKYQLLFERWLSDEELQLSELKQRHILSFIQKLTDEGKSKKHINMYLCILRHYFNCLLKQQKIKDNIAQGIVVKGSSRRLPHNLLSDAQLNALFEKYECSSAVSWRNKVMLSLIIYQGLASKEITKLEPQHINLEKGTIEINGTRRSNYRVLMLEGKQIMLMHQYINEHRMAILRYVNKGSNKLIVSAGSSEILQNTISQLLGQIRKQHPYVASINQIRNSVISNWLKSENLRKVQYMCGHRYVSSTERYQQNNLEDLKKEILQHHPLQ